MKSDFQMLVAKPDHLKMPKGWTAISVMGHGRTCSGIWRWREHTASWRSCWLGSMQFDGECLVRNDKPQMKFCVSRHVVTLIKTD